MYGLPLLCRRCPQCRHPPAAGRFPRSGNRRTYNPRTSVSRAAHIDPRQDSPAQQPSFNLLALTGDPSNSRRYVYTTQARSPGDLVAGTFCPHLSRSRPGQSAISPFSGVFDNCALGHVPRCISSPSLCLFLLKLHLLETSRLWPPPLLSLFWECEDFFLFLRRLSFFLTAKPLGILSLPSPVKGPGAMQDVSSR